MLTEAQKLEIRRKVQEQFRHKPLRNVMSTLYPPEYDEHDFAPNARSVDGKDPIGIPEPSRPAGNSPAPAGAVNPPLAATFGAEPMPVVWRGRSYPSVRQAAIRSGDSFHKIRASLGPPPPPKPPSPAKPSKWAEESLRGNRKPVTEIGTDRTWPSVSDLASELGVLPATVCNLIKFGKQFDGRSFRYATQEERETAASEPAGEPVPVQLGDDEFRTFECDRFPTMRFSALEAAQTADVSKATIYQAHGFRPVGRHRLFFRRVGEAAREAAPSAPEAPREAEPSISARPPDALGPASLAAKLRSDYADTQAEVTRAEAQLDRLKWKLDYMRSLLDLTDPSPTENAKAMEKIKLL